MKKISIMLGLIVSINYGYAITSVKKIDNYNTKNSQNIKMEDYMKSKNGNFELKEGNKIIIDKKVYRTAIDFHMYGKLTKNNYVKFNTNKDNQIVDMWIIK